MSFNKKIIIVIPARGGSKGVKFKNLRKIFNKSLVEITIDFSKSLKITKFIAVSSDNKKILKLATKKGVIGVSRPKKLSGDLVSDFKVIFNTVRNIEIKRKENFDYIFYLQPTSPFRKKKDILKAFEKVKGTKYDCSFSVSPINVKYHPKKIFNIQNKRLNLYSKDGEKIIARQQLEDVYIRNGIFYIFKRDKLFSKKSIYLKKNYPFIINYNFINIDTLQDLKKSRLIAKGKKNF